MNDENSVMKRVDRNGLELPTMTGIAVLFVYYYFAQKWSETGKCSNIEIYILSAVLFFGTVFIAAVIYLFLTEKMKIKFIVPAKFMPVICLSAVAWGGGSL